MDEELEELLGGSGRQLEAWMLGAVLRRVRKHRQLEKGRALPSLPLLLRLASLYRTSPGLLLQLAEQVTR